MGQAVPVPVTYNEAEQRTERAKTKDIPKLMPRGGTAKSVKVVEPPERPQGGISIPPKMYDQRAPFVAFCLENTVRQPRKHLENGGHVH